MQYPGTEADKKFNIVSCCFDAHDNMHLLFSREVASGNELVHAARPGNQLFWQPETCLAASQLLFSDAALIRQPGILAAYWIEHGNIYYCASGDLGKTWNKQSSYHGLKEKQLYCMSYSSNFSGEAPRVSGLCVPGNYTQGFSLAFYKDDQLKAVVNKDDRLKAALNIEEEPACSTSDINKEATGTDIYNSIEKHRPEYCPEACREYARYYDKLFTEIEKLDIRQTLLEAEISSLKKQIAEDKTREAKALNNESISTEKVQSVNKADKHSDTGIVPAAVGSEANKQEPDKSAKDKQQDKEKTPEKTMPLMVGAGFSFVTPEYLKSLKKQEPGGLK
jgi:hypothetical protein